MIKITDYVSIFGNKPDGAFLYIFKVVYYSKGDDYKNIKKRDFSVVGKNFNRALDKLGNLLESNEDEIVVINIESMKTEYLGITEEA